MITVDSRQLNQARLELRAMVRNYLFSPEYAINLIDFGFPRRTNPQTGARYWDIGSVALRFHVTKKYTLAELDELKLKRLPRRIGQFQTDVIEAEYETPVPAGSVSRERNVRRGKLCGGLGISVMRDVYGTLGAIVRDVETGAYMVLTNWHVLYGTRVARANRPVYQPLLLSGSPQPDVVARVVREHLTVEAPGQLPLDVALAILIDQEGWENNQLGIGGVTGVGLPKLGMQVVKSGLVSGITHGVVTGIEGFSKMIYDFSWPRLIDRVVTISRWPLDAGIGLVSNGGDSGAMWLDAATNQAIALHYAGLRDGTRAQGMQMTYVLDALGVTLADGSA
jgi:endonuclease G